MKKRFKEMLENGQQVFAPCVWDCMGAIMAERIGYDAVLVSGGSVARYMNGLPDIGLITADDLVRATEKISDFTSLPCIVDGDDGYGDTPLTTYRLVKRLIRAGAQGVTIEDSTGFRGFNRWADKILDNKTDGSVKNPVVTREAWLAKIKAAVDASKGTDCVIIARTEAKVQFGMEEALERARLAKEVGAHMVLVMDIRNNDDAKAVSAVIPGWKMWPDITTANGIPDIDMDEILPLGFNFVTVHTFEKGAEAGMYEYGKRTFDDKTTVWHDAQDMGMPQEYVDDYNYMISERHWLIREKKYMDLSDVK